MIKSTQPREPFLANSAYLPGIHPKGYRRRGFVPDVDQHVSLRSFSQPIYDLVHDQVFALEILTRLTPSPGMLQPSREPESVMDGLSTKNSRVLMDLACLERTFHALHNLQSPFPPNIFVNTDPALYEGDIFASNLPFWLKNLPFPASSIVFEITENYLVEPEAMRVVADHIRAAGLRIALDDLGAGAASLRAITALEPEFIKLDRALVEGLHKHALKRQLIASLVLFAEGAGIGFIAEGVERPEELMALRDLGVRYAQGYHLQRPTKIDINDFRTIPQVPTRYVLPIEKDPPHAISA